MEENNGSWGDLFPNTLNHLFRAIGDGIKSTRRPTDKSEFLLAKDRMKKKVSHSDRGSKKSWGGERGDLSDRFLTERELFAELMRKSDPKTADGMALGMVADRVPSLEDFLNQVRMLFCFGSDDKEGRFCLVVIEEIEEARSILGIGAVINRQPELFSACRKSSDDRSKEEVVWKESWNKKKNTGKEKERQRNSDLIAKNQRKKEKGKGNPIKGDPVA